MKLRTRYSFITNVVTSIANMAPATLSSWVINGSSMLLDFVYTLLQI